MKAPAITARAFIVRGLFQATNGCRNGSAPPYLSWGASQPGDRSPPSSLSEDYFCETNYVIC